MISTVNELKLILKEEKLLYLQGCSWKRKILYRFTHEYIYEIHRFVFWLRICEFFYSKQSRMIFKLALLIARRRKNLFGRLLNIEIHENCFDKGLLIFHGNIIVNSNVRVGKNCKLHGMNCIGNNGKDGGVPCIGDDVELGIGSVIMGDIEVYSECIVGANAVVNKTFNKKNLVLVGIPAKESHSLNGCRKQG